MLETNFKYFGFPLLHATDYAADFNHVIIEMIGMPKIEGSQF